MGKTLNKWSALVMVTKLIVLIETLIKCDQLVALICPGLQIRKEYRKRFRSVAGPKIVRFVRLWMVRAISFAATSKVILQKLLASHLNVIASDCWLEMDHSLALASILLVILVVVFPSDSSVFDSPPRQPAISFTDLC